jgi:hypothetical protein
VIVLGGIPSELKHLSKMRKINQLRDSVSSGERNRNSLNPVARLGVAGLSIWDEILVEERSGMDDQRG